MGIRVPSKVVSTTVFFCLAVVGSRFECQRQGTCVGDSQKESKGDLMKCGIGSLFQPVERLGEALTVRE